MYFFASDMHLHSTSCRKGMEREMALIAWLDRVAADAEAIFLLGDVFDFWFEYKYVVPKGFSRLLGKFSELADRGVKIHIFTGNHDQWTVDYLEKECGIMLHKGYGIFNLYGKCVFMAHGDAMGLNLPLGERIINAVFRSKVAKRLFSCLVHPDLAMRFGYWWSGQSRKAKDISHVFREEREPLIRFAEKFSHTGHIDYFIFGHTHCVADYKLESGAKALFLGEWFHNPCFVALKPDGEIEFRNVPDYLQG